ncbi:hypothetical protein BAU08_08825 [Bordetella bronchialis]|uniref:RHS repeat-associated core domain-containing protein n=2 Tax=Bordetella bronchialis TaxID=463025 RepID=A0A193FVP7_9BORD|nr:hypothetical protein BAU08_08825 [Bordetella bronchialis]
MSCLRYDGYPHDAVTGGYALGHGHRLYLPGLMRFNRADPLSPFAAGGIHTYAYCAGDPVHRTDPRGAFPIVALAALVIAAVDVAAVMRSARKAISLTEQARGLSGIERRRVRTLAAFHAVSAVSTTSGIVTGALTAIMGFSAPDSRDGPDGWLSDYARDLLWLTVGLSAVGGVAGGGAHIVGKVMPRAAEDIRPEEMVPMPWEQQPARRPEDIRVHRPPLPRYADVVFDGDEYHSPPPYEPPIPPPRHSINAPPAYSVEAPNPPSPPPDDPAPPRESLVTPL